MVGRSNVIMFWYYIKFFVFLVTHSPKKVKLSN